MHTKSLKPLMAGALLATALSPMLATAADVWSVRNTHIRKSPAFGSKKVLPVSRGGKLEYVKRKGGWVQVKSGNTKGWMRSYEVRRSQLNISTAKGTQKQGLANTIQGLSRSTSSLFGSKASQSTQKSVVATLGVRGLSEDELNKAKPDYKTLDSLQAYQANVAQSQQLAKQAALQPIRIKYIRKKR